MPPVVMHLPVMPRRVTHPHVTLPRVMHLHAMLRRVTHPHVTLRHRWRIRSFNSSGEISWDLPFYCTHGVMELWSSGILDKDDQEEIYIILKDPLLQHSNTPWLRYSLIPD